MKVEMKKCVELNTESICCKIYGAVSEIQKLLSCHIIRFIIIY